MLSNTQFKFCLFVVLLDCESFSNRQGVRQTTFCHRLILIQGRIQRGRCRGGRDLKARVKGPH